MWFDFWKRNSHVYAKLSTYEGNPFVVGHSSNTFGNTAESFSLETNSWRVEADYPFSKRFETNIESPINNQNRILDSLTTQQFHLVIVYLFMGVTMGKLKCEQSQNTEMENGTKLVICFTKEKDIMLFSMEILRWLWAVLGHSKYLRLCGRLRCQRTQWFPI